MRPGTLDPPSAPVFAVVGRVNKGKSSIVSTLAEDDSVRIDKDPGTTTEVRAYPVEVDGRRLLTLLDTPGFQRAPEVLAWLEARGVSAGERPRAVAELVAAFEGGERFADECRLLRPILDGAGILYVVDGAHPYRPNYDAEMEILRWTGRPRMALINRIGPGDHAAEWRAPLSQYFSFVRDFDAHSVTFEERMALLGAFRELDPAWRESVDETVRALVAERDRRRREAAQSIAGMLADELSLTLDVTVRNEVELETGRRDLEERFHRALREREAQERREVEEIYRHRVVRWQSGDLDRPVLRADLFAEEVWRVLGLSPGQLVAAGTTSGAVVGGAIDVAVGGASFLAGTVIGAAVGAAGAVYWVGQRFMRARSVEPGLLGLWRGARSYIGGGQTFRIGPHRGVAFPWVLLDRALLHYRSVATLTHARRGPVELPAAELHGIVSGLSHGRRRALESLFRGLRKGGDPSRRAREALLAEVLRLLEDLDPAVHRG